MRKRAAIFFLLPILISLRAQAAVFPVTTIGNSGDGSLRQAILNANAAPGPDIISFNIEPAGFKSIGISTELPEITDPVTIDGTTQPGFAGTPIIQINGGGNDIPYALKISSGSSVIRSIILNNIGFNTPGDGIVLSGLGGNRIVGCFLGVDKTGLLSSRIKGPNIKIDNSPDNLIGGTAVADRNIISGSSASNIQIIGPASSNNRVLGNYIGLNVAGAAAIAAFLNGIEITNAPNNTIGGLEPGAGNVISGNGSPQIQIIGPTASGNVIQGNLIGLKADATALTASLGFAHGIRIDQAPNNLVGGTSAAARNLIANGQTGVLIIGVGASGNKVHGNFIGVSPDGFSAIPNNIGVFVGKGAEDNLIGGTAPGEGNLISGNAADGVNISQTSNNKVQGNLIGTDVTGQAPLGNTKLGNAGSGVTIGSSFTTLATNNLIGGTAPGARNIISGNNDSGLVLVGGAVRANLVQGNFIGVSRDGLVPMGNRGRGINLLGANETLIGGDDPAARNRIENNGRPARVEGVYLASTFGGFGTPGTNNLVLRNTIADNGGAGVSLLAANDVSKCDIYANGGIPIDRKADGPTPNTPGDPSNYPEIASAVKGSIVLSGRLDGTPGCTYRVEVFLLHDGKRKYVGEFSRTIGASGSVLFTNVKIESDVAQVGDKVSTTVFAANCGGAEISEFSPELALDPPVTPPAGRFKISKHIYRISEDGGSVIVTVLRTENSSGPASVRLTALTPGEPDLWIPARAGVDYTLPDPAVLTFGDMEDFQSIAIPLNNDTRANGSRAFYLKLADPVNGTVDPEEKSIVFILDDEVPTRPKVNIVAKTGGELEISSTIPDGQPVVLQVQDDLAPGVWRNCWLLTQTAQVMATIIEYQALSHFYRVIAGGPIGSVRVNVVDPSGDPAPGYQVKILGADPVVGPDGESDFDGVPIGPSEASVEKPVTLRDPDSGEAKQFTPSLQWAVEVGDADLQALTLKVRIEADHDITLPPSCKCTPWAGVMGGTINGVQTVSVGGGKNGFCLDTAEVHVTGPGGIDYTFRPGQKRDKFAPAANGVWKVTSTVCDKTKTVEITLP